MKIIDCTPVGENDAILGFDGDHDDIVVTFDDEYRVTGVSTPDNVGTVDREREQMARSFVARARIDAGLWDITHSIAFLHETGGISKLPHTILINDALRNAVAGRQT